MMFGSYQWHLHQNLALSKQAAQIYMSEYIRSGKHFCLQFAIESTCRALRIKKQIRGMA
jgi:hypothetical protein